MMFRRSNEVLIWKYATIYEEINEETKRDISTGLVLTILFVHI